MSLTFLQLRTDVGDLLHDPAATTVEINTAINHAIDRARLAQVYYSGIDETITTVLNTYEYEIPSLVGNTPDFVAIYRLSIAVASSSHLIIPLWHWTLIPTTPPKIQFYKYLADIWWGTPPKTLRIEGQKIQARLSADGDILQVSDALVKAWALSAIHAGHGGTGSDLQAWHSQQQQVQESLAQDILARGRQDRIFGLHPDAQIVPTGGLA